MATTSPSRSAPGFALLMPILLMGSVVGPQRSEAADTASDQALCRRLWEDHLEAVTASQPQLIAFAKDAVVTYPDMPPLRGREAIQAHLVKMFAALKVVKTGFKMERSRSSATCLYVRHRRTRRLKKARLASDAASDARRRATVWEQATGQRTRQIAHLLVNYLKMQPAP